MWFALIVAAGACLFAGLIFSTVFNQLDPTIVRDDYKPCCGGWEEAIINHCNQGLESIPQQPVNTYSNLAFLAAGVFVAYDVQSGPSAVFAATMAYLCIGSTLYHATSTRWGGMLDLTAIYAAFAALAVYTLSALLGLDAWLTTALMFAGGGLAAYLMAPRFKREVHLKIGILLGATYLFWIFDMVGSGSWSSWPNLVFSLVLYAIAFLCWNLDKAQQFPFRGWGHGVWHVLCAAASVVLFYGV